MGRLAMTRDGIPMVGVMHAPILLARFTSVCFA